MVRLMNTFCIINNTWVNKALFSKKTYSFDTYSLIYFHCSIMERNIIQAPPSASFHYPKTFDSIFRYIFT